MKKEMSFSQRYGYKPVRDIIQLESIDEPLRTGLWNLLDIHYWDYFDIKYYNTDKRRRVNYLRQELWINYFKKPLDCLDGQWLSELRKYFFTCEWYEVYDFIEFVVKISKTDIFRNYENYKKFINACNHLLEKEMSAYRFVNDNITRITEKQEVEEIEQALEKSAEPVKTHLNRALELLSDRNNPDYRNSIKEAISAVESLVCLILNKKETLGKLLKKMDDEHNIHPALKAAFSQLYGYTSDEGGIRHALIESEKVDFNKVDFNEAKFMLVVCSAFINYVYGKTQN